MIKRLNRPRLHIVYLMLRDNIFEIPSLIGLAKDMDIMDVVLINLIHVTTEWQDKQRVFRCTPSFPNPSHQVKENLTEGKISSLLVGKPTKKIPSPLVGEGKGEGIYEEVLQEAERKAKELKVNLKRHSLCPVDVVICEEDPLRNLYISTDGEVSPCVYLYPPVPSPFKRMFCGSEYNIEKLSFGNIFKEPLHEIWNRKEYVDFRNQFIMRDRASKGLSLFLRNLKRLRGFEEESLPEPPEKCSICHKMLGF
jgi:hypothetical protein